MQEAAHELCAFQRQALGPARVAIVLVADGHPFVIDREDARIGDRDAVGIAGQVVDDGGGMVETVLGVEHPFTRHQGVEHGIDFALARDAVQFALRRGPGAARSPSAPGNGARAP